MNKIKKLLKEKKPIIMGILNITPDSFSDGGDFYDTGKANQRLDEMAKSGTDIIDIGAESTGPGSKAVGAKEELSRIKKVLSKPLETCISIDTYRAETARYCLEQGAEIINDVSALRADNELAKTIAEHNAYVVIMYSKQKGNQPNVKTENIEYSDVIATISEFLTERIGYAMSQGIKKEKIILDPGMGGFISSDSKYSWEILRRLDEFKNNFKEFPILIGTSRKGFLGGDIKKRDPISQLSSLFAATKGASIIRTHNPEMANEFHKTWNHLNHLA